MAVITISSDTTWSSSQTNTDGYIVDGATLTIDAVTGTTNIVVTHGTGGAGDFVVQEDAKLKLVFSDSYTIQIGGTNGNQANSFKIYGVIATDYQGTGTSQKCNIGTDGTNKIDAGAFYIYAQPETKLENVWFVTDYAYGILEGAISNALIKNCKLGDGTESDCLWLNKGQTVWWEDTEFDSTTYVGRFSASGTINEVGTNTYNGHVMLANPTYNDMYRRWKRAYIVVKDSAGNALSGMHCTLMDSNGKYTWSGITDANGKVDKTKSRFGLDYLLGCYEVEDDFNGTTTISSSGNKSVLMVSDPTDVYSSKKVDIDMSSDYGSSGSFTTVTMTKPSSGGGGGRQVHGMM